MSARQCEGVRVDVHGDEYPCPLKIRTPGKRPCGRCQMAHDLGWFDLKEQA